MGLFDFLYGSAEEPKTTDAQDIARAKTALRYFHDKAAFYPQNYSMSFEELVSAINKKSPAFLSGFGLYLNTGGVDGGISESRVQKVMEGVAVEGQGRLPSSLQVFFNRMVNEAVKIDYWEAAVYTAKETTRDVLKGLAVVGPLVAVAAVGFVLFWAYSKVKK